MYLIYAESFSLKEKVICWIFKHKIMKDEFGDRMKGYEAQSSYKLPKRSYFVIRLDGKGFSKWTKKLDKPFDKGFAEDMVETAKYLCANLQGAMFDSRVFVVPDPDEVMNVFWWRQKDASKNSISMACYANFSHKQVDGKNSSEKQDMLFKECGINWNDYDVVFKRGVVIKKEGFLKNGAERSRWAMDEAPIFSQDWSYLSGLIPVYNANLFKTEKERELFNERK